MSLRNNCSNPGLKSGLVPLQPLFDTGALVYTNGIAALMERGLNPLDLFARHAFFNDWGDLCDDDKKLNEEAIVDGGRIFSAYVIENIDERIYVITEADRSQTTILLATEY